MPSDSAAKADDQSAVDAIVAELKSKVGQSNARYSVTRIDANIDEILSKFDEAKGKTKEQIFREYSHDQKVIAVLPDDMDLPPELRVETPEVRAAQNFILDHVHNHPHETAYDASDVKRVLKLIDPTNEMRVVPQRQSSSLAFIGENPNGGWDCVVIAPRRGQFYILKTLFGQKRKPYQGKTQIRYSVSSSSGRNEAAGSLLRGPLASIRDVNQTRDSIAYPVADVNPVQTQPETPADAYGSMTDVRGRPVARHSVRRASNAASPRDLATALIASRRLAANEARTRLVALRATGTSNEPPEATERAVGRLNEKQHKRIDGCQTTRRRTYPSSLRPLGKCLLRQPRKSMWASPRWRDTNLTPVGCTASTITGLRRESQHPPSSTTVHPSPRRLQGGTKSQLNLRGRLNAACSIAYDPKETQSASSDTSWLANPPHPFGSHSKDYGIAPCVEKIHR